MKDSRKKVLFFINSYAGGAEKMTVNIAGFLDRSMYEVVFYILEKEWGLIDKFLPSDCKVNYIKIRSYKDNLLFKLGKAIQEENPDFVFSSLMPINWRLAMASAFFPKVKVVLRVNNYLYTQSFIQKVRLFLAYRFVDKLIVQTDEMNLEHVKILQLENEKVVTLANPVNISQIEDKVLGKESLLDHSNINYVYVGRIDPIKGLDVLLQAFSIVLKNLKKSYLYIIGEIGGGFEKYYSELLQLSIDLGITDYVVFTGFTDNPYLYVKYASCLVLSSRNEGLPNVVIESLHLGTPVAVTRSVPVINRIVKEGINGYTCEVDDINGLSNAMISASELGRISSNYQSARPEDFQNLFI